MSYLSTRSARKMQLAMHGRVIDLIHLRDQVLKLSILAELPGSDRDRLLGNIERAFETADKEFQVYTTLLLEKKGSERVSRVLSRTIW
jgi:hypothetical protein